MIEAQLKRIRRSSSLPVAVGFGISTPEQASAVARSADGVIVGGAIVRMIEQHSESPDLAAVIGKFVAELKKASEMRDKTKHHLRINSKWEDRRKDPMERIKTELSIQQARLAVLRGMSQLTRQARSMEELYDSYLKTILKVTRTQAGSILLLDRATGRLEFVAYHEEGASKFLHQSWRLVRGSRAGWRSQGRLILR
jgi:hypothetical protein